MIVEQRTYTTHPGKRMIPLLQTQESKFLMPAAFFTPQWQD